MIRKKDRKVMEIKKPVEGGNKMDILITMAYTALMTLICVKVIEHTPSEHK